ncbi:Blue-sensitive opsin [Aphelenchoides bicaudatus]|nr:Blue-sensitive opsin [Aphelenchoides bicaudatus]
MSSCLEIGSEDIQAAVIYYNDLLSVPSSLYNAVHVYVYHFLCVLGVLANICIVVVLWQPSMRKNPFNLFLIAVAVCDGFLMLSYFIFKQIEMCHPFFFSYTWTFYTLCYACTSVFLHSASLWLTVNMAVLRFLVLRDSSKSGTSKLNNYRTAIISIVVAIVISLIGATPNMLRYKLEDGGMADIPPRCYSSKYAHYYSPGETVRNYGLARPAYWNCTLDRFSFWIAGLMLKIIPCCLLTVFMTLLVKMLLEAKERRSRLTNSNTGSACGTQGVVASGGKSQAERTTAMLVIIVFVFLLTEMPQAILLVATGIQPTVRFAMPHVGDFVDLLSLLNSSVNFILYSTMSVLFRKEFLKTFGFCFPQPLKQWHSKRKLKSNGTSIRGINSGSQTPSTKRTNNRFGTPTTLDQTERLIDGENTHSA